ncbi:MAG TPA: peroxidase family protein [Streptosporangiaceae bacterium]
MTVLTGASAARAGVPFEVESLDGHGNNLAHPEWGMVGRPFSRVGPVGYADGVGAPAQGPNSRYLSNRIHNDVNENLTNETQVSQWGFLWGQFLDHTLGLRESAGDSATQANIPFDGADPMESFRDDLGVIPFTRSAAAPGTGTGRNNPRQQTNTISSYIDASAVYGTSAARLDWLRQGPADGDPANNAARLLLPGDYLPRRTERGDPAGAPAMDHDGLLTAHPEDAAVAGDQRANENIALTALHTLFAREHNRIVSLLPGRLGEQAKFEIARRVVIAEEQYITYNEFLPAMGITLPRYTGYHPWVDTTLSNEFSTVGFRAHSQINGEFTVRTDASRYRPSTLAALRAQGVTVTTRGGRADIEIPLNVAFFNPDLVPMLQLGPILRGLADTAQANNDEQIDNQLRSTLFQIPVSGNPGCLNGPTLPQCFQGVMDLGAIDIERGRDHGIPTYNQLRRAYGLPARTSFAQITGEDGDAFPADPKLTPGNEVNDPDSLDFTGMRNLFGTAIDPGGAHAARGDGVTAVRRTPLAARLRAMYHDVDKVDAFVGMVAEPHARGTQFGELQRAIWTREFQRLRDGDRFFYENQQPALRFIRNAYGIDFRRNLGDLIAADTDIPRASLAHDVFFVHGDVPPTSCRVRYAVKRQWGRRSGGFDATIKITNTGTRPINGWTLRFAFPDGQRIARVWEGSADQDGVDVPIVNAAADAAIPPGRTMDEMAFRGTWHGENAGPAGFSLNTTQCSTVTDPRGGR